MSSALLLCWISLLWPSTAGVVIMLTPVTWLSCHCVDARSCTSDLAQLALWWCSLLYQWPVSALFVFILAPVPVTWLRCWCVDTGPVTLFRCFCVDAGSCDLAYVSLCWCLLLYQWTGSAVIVLLLAPVPDTWFRCLLCWCWFLYQWPGSAVGVMTLAPMTWLRCLCWCWFLYQWPGLTVVVLLLAPVPDTWFSCLCVDAGSCTSDLVQVWVCWHWFQWPVSGVFMLMLVPVFVLMLVHGIDKKHRNRSWLGNCCQKISKGLSRDWQFLHWECHCVGLKLKPITGLGKEKNRTI